MVSMSEEERRRGVAIPPELYAGRSLVVRPRDLAGRWSQPAKELRRLASSGVVRRLAHGYYVVPPPERALDPGWRAEVEAVALAVAVADYGPDRVAVMGVSAARRHGAFPRAVAVGVVAVPSQRPALTTTFGRVVFVERDITPLGVESDTTVLGVGFVTSVEQTLLDLADRPGLGGLPPRAVGEAMIALSLRVNWEDTLGLARRLRLHAAYVRARWVAATAGLSPTPWPLRRPVPSLGLLPARKVDPSMGVSDARA